MFCRAQRIAIAALFTLTAGVAQAQVVWQPTLPPLVTAENTTWFLSGEPIVVDGGSYYPAGAVQFFNRYQMVRSGSFRGIPLYTDTMLEPNSIVFVPLPGQRMQPYERPRTGVLAGTTGSRPPSFPPAIGAEATRPEGLMQAAAAPAQAPAYDLVSPAPELAAPRPTDAPLRAMSQPTAVGTSGRIIMAAPVRRVTTLQPPTGLNAIWINYDGRRWVGTGKAIDYDAASLRQIGTYQGWSVYRRNGDRSTIYIPAAPGRLARYTAKVAGD